MKSNRLPDPASMTELRSVFASLADHTSLASDDELAELRERVCRVVGDLREAYALPEEIIVRIRRVATEEGLGASGDRLLREVVKWCLEEYFK